jgi:hypothetical protein
MDSTEFFGNKGNIWKGKSGVYCIEQPALSVAFKTPIYKVGYARNSLYTRMSDYRSAYGVVPFKIYCLIEIPAGVSGKRSGYTLLSEQRLHKQLTADGRSVGANEWYSDLNHIFNVMHSLYKELLETIKEANKWEVYFFDKRTRPKVVNVIGEKEIKSKLYDGLIYGTRSTRANPIADY